MKTTIVLVIFLLFYQNIFAQQTVTLYPSNDAFIFNLPKRDNIDPKSRNYGSYSELHTMEWTWNGAVGTKKTLIMFDLSQIPKNSEIISASLSLYSDSEMKAKHSTLSGSNECLVQRITSKWDENTVTWNNRPNVTSQNQLILPASVSDTEDYENIDVTQLVLDMVGDPENSFGFFISMKTPERYRALNFASKENPNKSLRPKLVIKFSTKKEKDRKVSQEQNNGLLTLVVIDENMNIIFKKKNITFSELNTVTNELASGTYLFQIIDENLEINSFKVVK